MSTSRRTIRIAIFNRDLKLKIKALFCWDQPFLAGWVFRALFAEKTVFDWLVDQIFRISIWVIMCHDCSSSKDYSKE